MGDENKQFEASQQKLRKAREQGQVVKSKDLSTAIAIIIMFSVIYLLGPIIWTQLSALFVMIYEQIPNKHLEEIGYVYIFLKAIIPTTLCYRTQTVTTAFWSNTPNCTEKTIV